MRGVMRCVYAICGLSTKIENKPDLINTRLSKSFFSLIQWILDASNNAIAKLIQKPYGLTSLRCVLAL